MPYPAAGAAVGTHHPLQYEPPLGPAAYSPRGGDSSSAWELRPWSPVPAESLAPERAAAARPPRHECYWWPASFSSNAPPGGDSSSTWDKGERPRSPLPADPFAEYYDKLAGYFVEAARRLPLAQIPYLAHCIRLKGLAIGFADPVTNILLTTIDAFAHTEKYMIYPVDRTAIELTKHKITFADGARSSWVALNRFMVCYFRYLTGTQADLLLHKAGYDLRVAIEAVELHIAGPNYSELLQDSARTKTAFEDAAYPRCSAPNLLRLMTSSYSRSMVEPILEDLRRGGELTADCVYKLCTLLRRPWSSPPPRPPPPIPGTFRDRSGGATLIFSFGDDSFVTTRISKDGVATATVSSSSPTYAGCLEDTTNLVSMFPIHSGRLVSHTETLESPEFLPFLKSQLLDMIHGVYLKAIAILPARALREGHLLHSLVTAGHCYGPLDPVSNIVVNTIWYDATFPLSIASKVGAMDILDARSMHRIESRSIDGLVAYLRRSPSIDEQHAVTILCRNRLDNPILDLSNMRDVALAAKHPQPAAFGEFLEHVSIQELYNQYCLSRVQGNPDSAFEVLKTALLQETSQTTRVASRLKRCAHHMDASAALERSFFMSQQDHFRRVLETLLIGYGYTNPLVPLYNLGVICGVTRQRNYSCTDVYHANFLASSDGGSSWKLFFAEFWNQPDERIEESKRPFCCPIPDYHEYPGRCVVCENGSCIIVHPQSRKYYMGNSSLPFPILGHLGADTSEKLDFDVIYPSL
ncbi:uncharacterized protein [Lolium perenne]|uniref:uncharacterized protein n=1 Tax=Lolium perenne TaxID=4522 RepID=UPI0021F5938D|nr:uncharacterized protein LOC127295647 [Lolium perenne]XP_051181600.1 uncharacterized protein LOC127295647 [Lolium perenne]